MTLPPPECKVYTPPQLADAMVGAIEPRDSDSWLDPCIGPGAFITPLRKRGISKNRIVAIDIDPEAGREDGAATTLRGIDFFEWCSSTKRRFTKIIANPPYVAIRKLHPDLQKSLRDFGGNKDNAFALSSNYWCAFLSASMHVLEEDGNLSFVLPAAWEYALYATEVRQAVLDRFRCVSVHRCLEPLFPPVREGRVVLVAKGYRKKPASAVRVDHGTSEQLVAALKRGNAKNTQSYKYPPKAADENLIPFSDLYNITIGCVTGDAGYFLLTEAERAANKLPIGSVRPILSKARHLAKARVTKADWENLLNANERVWLFSPSTKSLRSKAVRSYIEHGEKVCNLDAYKLKHRDPWYQVKDLRKGVGFLSGMTKLGPWITFRSMRGLAATNTLYVLTAKKHMSADEHAAWALSLLSSPCRQQFNELARRYPDGLPKLEPHDLCSFRLPAPKTHEGAAKKYQSAIDLLVSDKIAEAVAAADKFIRIA